MRNKLMWFYQEVEEPEAPAVVEQPKPGPSRTAATSNLSKTPQGKPTQLTNQHFETSTSVAVPPEFGMP